MIKNIAVIRGDGIGPEITAQAIRVLDRIAELYGHTFNYTEVDMGGCAIDKYFHQYKVRLDINLELDLYLAHNFLLQLVMFVINDLLATKV